jgi:hypothetical protein
MRQKCRASRLASPLPPLDRLASPPSPSYHTYASLRSVTRQKAQTQAQSSERRSGASLNRARSLLAIGREARVSGEHETRDETRRVRCRSGGVAWAIVVRSSLRWSRAAALERAQKHLISLWGSVLIPRREGRGPGAWGSWRRCSWGRGCRFVTQAGCIVDIACAHLLPLTRCDAIHTS